MPPHSPDWWPPQRPGRADWTPPHWFGEPPRVTVSHRWTLAAVLAAYLVALGACIALGWWIA